MKEFLAIEVEERDRLGRSGARSIRRRGMVPGIVYGGQRPSVPITVDAKRLLDILSTDSGMNSILLLHLKGKAAKRHVMIKEYQRDPVTNELVHADFVRILLDEKIEVSVPVQIEGVAEGVKNQGGLLDFIMREIRVSCLPSRIPEHFVADVTKLEIGDSIKVGELPHGDEVDFLIPADRAVVVISPPVKEEEPVAPTEEEVPEPEVIQKGKAAEGEPEGKEGESPEGQKEKAG